MNKVNITVEQAKRLLKEGGTEIALRILTLQGWMNWIEGKELTQSDINDNPRLE